MPLTMVHLGVIHYLAERNDWIDRETMPQFYLGSISPDCVNLRQGLRTRDRARSHLWLENPSYRMPKNLIFWQNHVLDFLQRSEGSERSAFVLGYCIHVLTDIYWYETVYEQFRIRYCADSAPVLEDRLAFTNDIEQLELTLLNQSDWADGALDLLRASEGESLGDIVSAHEVDEWKRQTLLWLESGSADFHSPVRYFSQIDMNRFIEEAGNYAGMCMSRRPAGRMKRAAVGR